MSSVAFMVCVAMHTLLFPLALQAPPPQAKGGSYFRGLPVLHINNEKGPNITQQTKQYQGGNHFTELFHSNQNKFIVKTNISCN